MHHPLDRKATQVVTSIENKTSSAIEEAVGVDGELLSEHGVLAHRLGCPPSLEVVL